MALADLNTLINASGQNLSQFKGLTAAYVTLGFGVPTIDGYTALINSNNTTNFGSNSSVVFNDENIYINTMNALYQGNAAAKASFDAIVGAGATLQDKLTAVYNAIIPTSEQSDAGRAYFISQANFYQTRAAELGIAGLDGAALVGAAALIKIAVDNDIPGIGDAINDLRAAVANGSAVIPQDGDVFTPIETADGTAFDSDDASAVTVLNFTAAIGETVTGTGSDDTFNANLLFNAGSGTFIQTLQTGDRAIGGDGMDTVVVQIGGANAANATPGAFSSIETLDANFQTANVINLGNGDASLQTVNIHDSIAAATIIGVNSAVQNLNIQDQAGIAVTLTTNVAPLAGTTDAINVSLSNVTGGAAINLGVTGGAANGWETINVASGGAVANVIGVLTGSAGTTTENYTGAQNLTVASGNAGATTVNGGAMTGNLAWTAAAGSGVQTITGGTGADNFNLNGTWATTDIINGGDGSDVARSTSANLVAVTAAANANVTNVETLGVTDGLNGTVNVRNITGATGFNLAAATAITTGSVVNFAAGTSNLNLSDTTLAVAATLGINVNGVAGDDVVNVTAGNAATATGLAYNAASVVTFTGAETVNINSVGAANAFGVVTLTNTAVAESIVLTGNQTVTFGGLVTADVINAGGMTGTAALNLNAGVTNALGAQITGTGNADVLIASAGADIINAGGGNDNIQNAVNGTAASAGDVITTGAGFDTVTLRGDAASGNIPAVYASASLITDFTVGATATTTDILQLSATNTNYANAGTGFHTGISGAEAAGATAVQNVAQNAAAAAAVTGLDLIKLTTGVVTTGDTLQTAFNEAIGTATVTGLSGAGVEVFFSFYDTTNSRMVVGVVDTGADAIVNTGDTVSLVGTLNMTAADYAAFNANNFALIAA